jgi:hypothetical protein
MRSNNRRGALPRLRGRGEQGRVVIDAFPFSTLCNRPVEDAERDSLLKARGVRFSALATQSVDDRAQPSPRRHVQKFPYSPRPRERGSAPLLRIQAAFSLVEVLASLFVLTLSAVGITAAWRLADYQEVLTRADRRAERILRQYYELQTFAPPESRPFVANSSASPSAQAAITGYLYHPRLIAAQAGSSAFGDSIPFTISMTNGTAPGTNQLVFTYTIPGYGTQATRQVTKTVILNP